MDLLGEQVVVIMGEQVVMAGEGQVMEMEAAVGEVGGFREAVEPPEEVIVEAERNQELGTTRLKTIHLTKMVSVTYMLG